MDVVERWWNRKYGRLARRDIWLLRDERSMWHVRVRIGWADSHLDETFPFASEKDARRQVEVLLDDSYGRWRRLNG